MTSIDEIKIIVSMIFESYDEDDVAEAIISKFERDAIEPILNYINKDSVIEQALDIATESDIAEILDDLEHEDYTTMCTTRIDTQRMLTYLKEHLNEITLEDLEQIIERK